jgi:hypothetical protein
MQMQRSKDIIRKGAKMNLTPLEQAVLNAYELAVGLAAHTIVSDLIIKGDESRNGYLDRDLPKDVRAKALRSGREANESLALVATARELLGISA